MGPICGCGKEMVFRGIIMGSGKKSWRCPVCDESCPSCAEKDAELRAICGELGEFHGEGQNTAVEKIRFLRKDWEGRLAEKDARIKKLERRIANHVRQRELRYTGKARPISYMDTIDGRQTNVDNLWAITTEQLNEMTYHIAALERVREAAEWMRQDAVVTTWDDMPAASISVDKRKWELFCDALRWEKEEE